MRRLIELAADHAATILAIKNEAVGHDVLREVIAGLLGYEDYASVSRSDSCEFLPPSGQPARFERADSSLQSQPRAARAPISDVNIPAVVAACQQALVETCDGACVATRGGIFYKGLRYTFPTEHKSPTRHLNVSDLTEASSPVVGGTRRYAEHAKHSQPVYEPLVSVPLGKPRSLGADLMIVITRLDSVLISLTGGGYSHAYCGFVVHVDSNAVLGCAVSSTDDWSRVAAEALADALGATPASVESPEEVLKPFCPARVIKVAFDATILGEPLSGALKADYFQVLKPRAKDRVRSERLVAWTQKAVGGDQGVRSKRPELQESKAISVHKKEGLVQLIQCGVTARNLTLQNGAVSHPLELLRVCMLTETAPARPYEWRAQLYSALMPQS
jgi:hypothetical protein